MRPPSTIRRIGDGNSPSRTLTREYQPSLRVEFTADAWFNATTVAARFGKRPAEWLRLPETQRYLDALCRRAEVGKSHFARTARGGAAGRAGTWLHPKLAVPFARWLDVDFAVWCDEQIDALLRQRAGVETAQRLREVGELWHQRLQLEANDATSKALASAGSRLMLDRRRMLPCLTTRRAELEDAMQPSLFSIGRPPADHEGAGK
ncbi:KilA-N domain-containing protein [Aquabacterium sp.]|uniref:KilA-N domain-containing protein n=1 Tax=Aquabacterium sp. TaxID=1872578 RepID=UPI00378325C4